MVSNLPKVFWDRPQPLRRFFGLSFKPKGVWVCNNIPRLNSLVQHSSFTQWVGVIQVKQPFKIGKSIYNKLFRVPGNFYERKRMLQVSEAGLSARLFVLLIIFINVLKAKNPNSCDKTLQRVKPYWRNRWLGETLSPENNILAKNVLHYTSTLCRGVTAMPSRETLLLNQNGIVYTSRASSLN